jgi:MFS family permease
MGHGVSFPFLAIYFTSTLGVSAWMVGAVMSMSALAGGFSKYAGGYVSDRVGRKGVMLFALAGRGLTTLGIGLLALQEVPPWIPIAVLFVLGGAFVRVFEPASQAMVADISTVKTRTAGYGLLRVGTNLGWALGVMAGGLISETGYATMFLTTTVVIGLSFVLILLTVSETAIALVKPKEHVPEEYPKGLRAQVRALNAPGFFLLCGVGILVHIVMAQLMMPLSVYSKEFLKLHETQLGLLFFLNGMMVVVLQFPASRWVEGRFRLTTTLVVGSLLFAAGYGAICAVSEFHFLLVCVGVFTIGELLVMPGTVALAANIAPEDRRGLFLGAFGLVTMAGRFIGPLLGGMNLDLFVETPWIHWALVSVLGVSAALGFVFLRFRVAREADQA